MRGALAVALGLFGCAGSPPPARPHEPGPADAIVVLGHRPPLDRDGSVEYETRARVDRGVALFHGRRAPRLLLAGGQSTKQAVEADVMAHYAEQQGVPPDAILRERASKNTSENARLSVALLRETLRIERPRVVLVTSDYHIERATRLLRCAGAEVEPEPVPLPALSAAERHRRARGERLVRFVYAFIDECGRTLRG